MQISTVMIIADPRPPSQCLFFHPYSQLPTKFMIISVSIRGPGLWLLRLSIEIS